MATDTPMQLGMVGLGRMGAGIVRRLMRDGHRCVGYDVNADAVKHSRATASAARHARGVRGQAREAAHGLGDGAGGRDHAKTISAVAEVFETGDVIIDGGNTHYHDDIRHAAELREKGIHHVDWGPAAACTGSSAASA